MSRETDKLQPATVDDSADTRIADNFPENRWDRLQKWLILLMFVLYSASNAFQWTQLVIITNILEKYYEVLEAWN